MRIAFVVCGALESVSGGFLYDRRLIAGLRELGVTVDVFELPWWPYELALAQNLLPWPFEDRYDVILQDELCHPAVFLRNRRLRTPIVTLVHNLASVQPSTPRRPLVRACEHHYLRSVNAAIAVCADTLTTVRACLALGASHFAALGRGASHFAGASRGAALGRGASHFAASGHFAASAVASAVSGGASHFAVVARPGRDHVAAIDKAALERRDLSGPLRLAFVGQVAAHKGLHRMLPVLARLPGVILEVAGATSDAAYVRALQDEIGRAGLSPRVHLQGLLGADALAIMLARCHALVMPSDREAYPLSALEAMGAGLPVLITRAGGTAELLGEGQAGRLLDPDDSTTWIDVIAELDRDRGRLREMSHAAHARHLAHGTWAATAQVVRDFLQVHRAPRGEGADASAKSVVD